MNDTSLSNFHYTCFNETGECDIISYISGYDSYALYYIDLTNGKSIEDALVEMLSADNVNKTNSLAKSAIDAWYERYMIDYTDYLEDVVYCNNRSISYLGRFDPNSGFVVDTDYFDLEFKDYRTKSIDFSCSNETDRFSVSNPKAKLKYPVGLMSFSEYYPYFTFNYNFSWTMSPAFLQGTEVTVIDIEQLGAQVNFNGVSIVPPSFFKTKNGVFCW